MANNSENKKTLGVSLYYTVNSFYSVANAELLYEALADHRDTHLRLAFEAIQQEDYTSAYSFFSSYEDLNEMIKELTLGLVSLAHANYNAAENAGRSAASIENVEAKMKEDKAWRFNHWKETYVGRLEPKEDVSPEPSTAEELTASICALMDQREDDFSEKTHLLALMQGMPESDLAILHGLAEKDFSASQLSDVAYRLSK